MTIPWTATIAFEGVETVDGRILAPGAVTWPDLPVPVVASFGGETIGRVEEVWREGDEIRASGVATEMLGGRGAAVGITIDDVEIGLMEFAESITVSTGRLGEVCVTDTPAFLGARFDEQGPLRFSEVIAKHAPLDQYEQGLVDGLHAYAWWKDGTMYVGTSGTTLAEAIDRAITVSREAEGTPK